MGFPSQSGYTTGLLSATAIDSTHLRDGFYCTLAKESGQVTIYSKSDFTDLSNDTIEDAIGQ
jgi:hypothetical protein